MVLSEIFPQVSVKEVDRYLREIAAHNCQNRSINAPSSSKTQDDAAQGVLGSIYASRFDAKKY